MTNRYTKRTGSDDGLGRLLLALVILVLLPIIILIGGLITMLAWNLGVVALVAAAGGTVGKIGLITAIFVNFAIGIVARIFRPNVTTTAS